MKSKELRKLGLRADKPVLRAARRAMEGARQTGLGQDQIADRVRALAAQPAPFLADPVWGELAQLVARQRHPQAGEPVPFLPREAPAPCAVFLAPDAEEENRAALRQMEHALSLPLALRGALMPDAHVGYGLPIGGVLAVDNAVIPYAVGMDIACRMKLSVVDASPALLAKKKDMLLGAMERETRFGVGGAFATPRQHPVLDEDWSQTRFLKQLRDKARAQLGTSGSGNHFVEFGELHVLEGWGRLAPGRHLALLTHSGSRGTGGAVAEHYSRLAMERHPELPRHLRQLAWFDLDSADGREYWAAMELMGCYSAANHACIHEHILGDLGFAVVDGVENHHNFAWLEQVDGRRAVVHRKGATPAQAGTLGVIPGSMTAPGYVVRGRGAVASLQSASHGAGRCMSRGEAIKRGNWRQLQRILEEHGVTLVGGGLDESPLAYKDIQSVMAAQVDLVDVLARFTPRLVRMDRG